MKPLLCLLTLMSLSIAAPALGNGALASFPAGGVVFEDSADIAIAQEDLLLSPDEVRVHYRFVSSATEIQTKTIGFPLPRVPATPDAPDSVGPVAGGGGDARNYLGFGVAVDRRPLIPTLHEYAYLGKKDVTAALLEAGLPLLPQYESWIDLVATIEPAQVAELVEAGLVHAESEGYLSPLWDYQAIYEWQQDFAVGETEVDIHYVPLMGWPNDFADIYEVGEKAETACVTDEIRAEIAAHKAAGSYYEVAQLDYITTTAKHWLGPIGTFNLTVDVSQPLIWNAGYTDVLFASCPVAAKPLGQDQWGFDAQDYVPERDIRVFFYFFS
jgi:hypothetical protein